jgi:hypothetical protein
MARYLAATAAGAGAGNAFLVGLIAHLESNGWTQHDVISSTPGSRDVVMRGAALDATADIRPFVRFTQTAATTIVCRAYSDWDTGTHAGMNECGAVGSSNWTVQDATFSYYAWVDGYGGWVVAKLASANRAYFGFARRGLPAIEAGITKTTAPLSVGATSLPVASDMTGKLRVGQKVLLMNYAHNSASGNASNVESVTITSIGASAIGCSALTKAYDAGAVLGDNVCPVLASQSTTTSSALCGGIFYPFNLDGSRTTATAQTGAHDVVIFGAETSVDPEDINSKYSAGLTTFTTAIAGKTGFKGYPRGAVAFSGGAQALDDLMDDGVYTYLVSGAGTGNILAMGPREL